MLITIIWWLVIFGLVCRLIYLEGAHTKQELEILDLKLQLRQKFVNKGKIYAADDSVITINGEKIKGVDNGRM